MNNYTIYEEISKIYPCIFSISGICYYIGSGVFRECTTDEIKIYNSFCKDFFDIQEKGKVEYISYDSLKNLFSQIMFRKDFPYNDAEWQRPD